MTARLGRSGWRPASSGGGVTLQQIDGGPSYYSGAGFTRAVAAGWDDPSYFPIGQDYCFYPSNSAATFADLGLNFTHRTTSDASLPDLATAGVWVVNAGDTVTGLGAETVGWHVEEPDSWSDIESSVATFDDAITGSPPPSGLTGRFLQASFTWTSFVYGGLSGTPGDGSMQAVMSSPISTSAGNRHLDIPGDDIYWFAGSEVSSYAQYYGGLIYLGSGDGSTADQCARGSNYGDMVDMARAWTNPTRTNPVTYAAPVIGPYIETEDGLVDDGRRILPQEWNWAVWSTIVHGARWLLYFSTTSNYGSGSTFGFGTTVLSGASVSMYDQAPVTHALIADLAPVINSPFALNYASVSPAGYTFPVPHIVWDNGIDIMAKYYTGGEYSSASGTFTDGYYIFATVRGSASQTDISATFTTAGGYSGPVTVVGEDRTVTATGGVFTDTFATAYTVHIYQVGAA